MERKRRPVVSSARRQILTALLATIPTFSYGIQIGWLSPTANALKEAGVTASDISWLAAALPLAAICGIPFFSYSSDRFGRKCCIIAVSVLSCISWTIKLTTLTAPALIAARAIAGVAAAGCFVVIPVFVKEIAEDSWRGALASLTMTVCKLGVIFVYAVGMWLPYSASQAVYLAIAAAHAILFCFMPESPNYLLKRGREKKATQTIAWLRSLDRGDTAVLDEVHCLKDERRRFDEMPKVSLVSVKIRLVEENSQNEIQTYESIFAQDETESNKRKTLDRLWFRFMMRILRSSYPGRIPIIGVGNSFQVRDRATFSALRVTLMLMALQTLSGCFALTNYASDVFSRAGTDWSPNMLALLMGSLQLAGSFFTTMFIEKFGRKIPLGCSSGVVSLCMLALATYFLTHTGPRWLPVASVCLCILAYGAGLAPVPMVVMAEVFTYQMRARMAGVSMACSFFCSSMTVLFYTPVANMFGEHVVFYVFAAVTAWGVVYTVLWVPETKGKSLQEIREYWVKPEPVHV